MATLEDRILGDKLHYYCSSSEDEDASSEHAHQIVPEEAPPDITKQRESCSVNTGPKGVLKDWQRYQQLQSEKREEQERERLELIKKLSLTCKSEPEQQQTKARAVEQEMVATQDEDDDGFLREYMRRRMEEMMAQISTRPTFGQLVRLEDGQAFLDAVDREKSGVTVIVHIYAQGIPGCEAMNGCLQCLAEEYPQVKFCIVEASAAGMSRHFERKGVPALLVYKNGGLIGNFVRLTDEFGDDFFAVDVESFLVEHGFLPDQSLLPMVRQPATDDDDDGR